MVTPQVTEEAPLSKINSRAFQLICVPERFANLACAFSVIESLGLLCVSLIHCIHKRCHKSKISLDN